jgi:hypothetical protein
MGGKQKMAAVRLYSELSRKMDSYGVAAGYGRCKSWPACGGGL